MSFEIGDIVEVVKSFEGTKYIPPINRGQRYVVNNIDYCKGCKLHFLDIGLHAQAAFTQIPTCGCGTPSATEIPVYHFSYFRKIEPSYKVVEVTETIIEEIKELKYN